MQQKDPSQVGLCGSRWKAVETPAGGQLVPPRPATHRSGARPPRFRPGVSRSQPGMGACSLRTVRPRRPEGIRGGCLRPGGGVVASAPIRRWVCGLYARRLGLPSRVIGVLAKQPERVVCPSGCRGLITRGDGFSPDAVLGYSNAHHHRHYGGVRVVKKKRKRLPSTYRNY